MKKVVEKIEKETGYMPKSLSMIYRTGKQSSAKFWLLGTVFFLVLVLFLPWTQNIQSSGNITTLYQEQKPQQLNTIIPGRIVKWWVKEGDFVKKGATIVQIMDIKDDYLDPELVSRSREQLDAKEQKIGFYGEKIDATTSQIEAMEATRELKINSIENKLFQLQRKLQADSAALVSASIDLDIAKLQYERANKMYNDGIIALTEMERRTALFNKNQALYTEQKQKYENTKQDIIINRIDLNTITQEAADKIYKAKSEIAAARGDVASITADVAKNRNELANYTIRGSQRWLIAPQSGQIVKAKKAGFNETVKEGEMIVEIVPDNIKFAVELFIPAMDLVLVNKEQQIRLIFDGFPAIVFSGWPQASYGTFAGRVVAVETNRSENGQFRVLVVPDKNETWPNTLKIGAGAKGFAMLKNVSVWYELWRQINGFPPDYYLPTAGVKAK
jgi:multidrug efflux pump subunit AcrA (membrane-fusion protein)